MVKHLLGEIVAGRGSGADIDRILELCDLVKGSTLCPAGDAYAVPISTMVRKFRDEFEALLTR